VHDVPLEAILPILPHCLFSIDLRQAGRR
jgi:hypothetical protein